MLPRLDDVLVLAQDGRDKGLEAEAHRDPIWVEGIREMNQQFLANSIQKDLAPPSDAQIRQAYEKNKTEFPAESRLDVCRLLVKPRRKPDKTPVASDLAVLEEAKKIAQRLEHGETPEALAKNPASGQIEIELWRGKDLTRQELIGKDPAFPLSILTDKGVSAEPVRFENRGFALYVMRNQREAEPPALERIRDKIAERLTNDQVRERIERQRREIRDKLEIDPQLGLIPVDLLDQAQAFWADAGQQR
jgi:hypothetical protein